MKKLSRQELKRIMGGNPPVEGGKECNCLPGDPKGKCKTLSPCGMCQCTSSGAPAIYDLNDATCTCPPIT